MLIFPISTGRYYVYADVLLLYAESLNEWKQGPTDEAYKAINMVRRRGFGLPVETDKQRLRTYPDCLYDEFQKAVRNERAYELAFEGHRRQDLGSLGNLLRQHQKNSSGFSLTGIVPVTNSMYASIYKIKRIRMSYPHTRHQEMDCVLNSIRIRDGK